MSEISAEHRSILEIARRWIAGNVPQVPEAELVSMDALRGGEYPEHRATWDRFPRDSVSRGILKIECIGTPLESDSARIVRELELAGYLELVFGLSWTELPLVPFYRHDGRAVVIEPAVWVFGKAPDLRHEPGPAGVERCLYVKGKRVPRDKYPEHLRACDYTQCAWIVDGGKWLEPSLTVRLNALVPDGSWKLSEKGWGVLALVNAASGEPKGEAGELATVGLLDDTERRILEALAKKYPGILTVDELTVDAQIGRTTAVAKRKSLVERGMALFGENERRIGLSPHGLAVCQSLGIKVSAVLK